MSEEHAASPERDGNAGASGETTATSAIDNAVRAGGAGSEALVVPVARRETLVIPSTGWIDLEASYVLPWCAGVLVAPDVVLTAADCALARSGRIRFGFGVPGESEAVDVVASVALTRDKRLGALRLERAVELPEPAQWFASTDKAGSEGLEVTGAATRFVERGMASERWTWRGALHVADAQPSVAIAPDQRTNCHGDNGSGVYAPDGALVGIVVAGHGAGVCVDTVTLAPALGRGEEVLEEALEAFREI